MENTGQTKSGFSIAGFVLSIAGIIMAPLAILGIIFSSIALAKRQGRRGLAIAGLIIGIVVLIVVITLLIIFSVSLKGTNVP